MFPQPWLHLNLLEMDRDFQCSCLNLVFVFQIVCAHCHPAYFTYRVNWVEVDGTMYRKPCALVLTVDEKAPTFGNLLDIYVVGSVSVYFKVQPFDTIEYNSHFHCFTVKYSEAATKILSCTSLFSFVPHHVRILPGTISTLCVVPRHFLSIFDSTIVIFVCMVFYTSLNYLMVIAVYFTP